MTGSRNVAGHIGFYGHVVDLLAGGNQLFFFFEGSLGEFQFLLRHLSRRLGEIGSMVRETLEFSDTLKDF